MIRAVICRPLSGISAPSMVDGLLEGGVLGLQRQAFGIDLDLLVVVPTVMSTLTAMLLPTSRTMSVRE